MNDSDEQTKLCLQVMNHHKFSVICMLKYHAKHQCLVIYNTFYQAIVQCKPRYYFLTFLVITIEKLKELCREFMSHYTLHNDIYFFLVTISDK